MKIVSMIGGIKDTELSTHFQIANEDTGEIKFVHSAEVRQILNS